MTVAEKWSLDGWDLTEGGTRDVESRADWDYVSEARGEAVTIANRTGVLWTPKRRGAGGFGLNMWLAGKTPEAARAEYDLLLRAATPSHRLVVVRRTMPDGSVRVCDAELVGSIAPTPIGRRGFRVSLQFSIPDGSWREVNYRDYSVGGAAGALLAIPTLAGSTAPIERTELWFHGPATTVMARDVSVGGNGDWVRYNGAIPAGGVLHLNSWDWSIEASGFTPNLAAVQMSGPRFLTQYPLPPGQPSARHTLRLEGDWGAGSSLGVRATSQFL